MDTTNKNETGCDPISSPREVSSSSVARHRYVDQSGDETTEVKDLPVGTPVGLFVGKACGTLEEVVEERKG
jgi:hypothetical protein